jgi:ABC-type polysaccharide transport system permease subunit
MTVANQHTPGPGSVLERPFASRKLGVVIVFALSLVVVALSLPIIPWFGLSNVGAMIAQLQVDINTLRSGYSLFNFLSFVQVTKMGVLGFPAMILMIFMVATLLLHAIFLVRTLLARAGSKGALGLYSTAQTALLFSFIAAVASIFYASFVSGEFAKEGMPLSFTVSPVVFIVPVLSAAGYVIIKMLERRERVIQHEHGFLVELRRNWILFVFLVPCFIYFLINNYLPMAGVYFAFTQFNFRDGLFASPYIGFKNFEFLVNADLFRLTRNTILYNLVFIGVGNVLQIIFAIFVSQAASKWFKRTSQTLIFMPYFVSYVILKVIVYNIFEYDFGLINSYLAAFGIERLDFYNTTSYWPWLITGFYLWKNLGYGMVVYLATIMGISDEYYDAAKVDGANVFQQIMYITVPMLKPTFIILLLYALGGIMKGQFELFYQLVGTNGVLFNVTDIFDTYVYRITTTQPLSMGLGTAAGLYQSIFGFVIIVVTNFIIKRRNEEYALF